MLDPETTPENIPLFPADYRGSGLLLPVTSLPSPYGIGDVGPAAFDWIDRLQASGQNWWQALLLGPPEYGSPPYQSSSSFAANWLSISPDFLIQDELLRTRRLRGLFLLFGIHRLRRRRPLQALPARRCVGQLQRAAPART